MERRMLKRLLLVVVIGLLAGARLVHIHPLAAADPGSSPHKACILCETLRGADLPESGPRLDSPAGEPGEPMAGQVIGPRDTAPRLRPSRAPPAAPSL
jgi:hypothetical protein